MTDKFRVDELCHHEALILACLRKRSPDREGILEEYEQLVQFMGIPVTFSGKERAGLFTGDWKVI